MKRVKAFLLIGQLSAIALAGCATSPNPCGLPPASELRSDRAAFADPYTGWRQVERSVAVYTRAVAQDDKSAIARSAWNVCRSTDALAPFTREVAIDIRSRFVETRSAVVRDAKRVIANGAPEDVSSLSNAVNELGESIPRFWLHPAASLRGARQSGNRLHTHN